MPDHLLSWIAGVVAGCAATVAVAIATRVRLLPDVVDVSMVPTMAGVGSLLLAAYGGVRRFPPERIGRLTLLGTLIGGGGTLLVLGLVLTVDVLS